MAPLGVVAATLLSTIDEAFADCALPTPLGHPPLWGLGTVPNNWAGVCGLLKPPGSQRRFWKVNKHGAGFPFLDKLFVYDKMIKAATMGRGFICIVSIGITNGNIKLSLQREHPP